MITSRVFAAIAIMASVAGTSWAAAPNQVGTWVGSSKVTTFTGGTNKSVSKQDMQIDIAADDTTTITVGGVVQDIGSVVYNATDGLFAYGPAGGNQAHVTTINFKNTTIKGTSVGFTTDGASNLVSTAEGKYKLKKQQ